MAAQSRVEQILKSMLGLAEDIPKPQSRIEELLIDLKQAIDGGGSGDLTEIVGRIFTLERNVDEIKMVDDAQNKAIDELDEHVIRKTDYATKDFPGVVIVSADYGVVMGGTNSRQLRIQRAQDTDIDSETHNYRPIVPSSIPRIMKNYGIEYTTQILDMKTQINELKASLNALLKNGDA